MRDWRRQQIPQTPNVARLSPCHRHSGVGGQDGDDDCDGGGQKICYNCIIVLMKMTLSSPVQPHSLFWKFTQSFGGAEWAEQSTRLFVQADHCKDEDEEKGGEEDDDHPREKWKTFQWASLFF